MAFDYNLFGQDDPYSFDFGLFSRPQNQNQNQNLDPTNRFSRDRLAGLTIPQFDSGPMERYQRYLGEEPSRKDYQPNLLRRILAGASGGVEAMSSGNIARGWQLGRAMLDRPYDEAYDEWRARGNKLKADMAAADARFRNQMTAYDKMVDNAARERQLDYTGRNVELREKELELNAKKFFADGWKLETDEEGNAVYTRMNPQTGQPEINPAGFKTNELTPGFRKELQEMSNEAAERRAHILNKGAMERARFNQGEQTSRQLRQLSFNAVQNAANRAARGTQGPTVATPVNTRTVVGLMENKYPDLNTPEFEGLIRLEGNNRIQLGLDVTDPKDSERLKEVIRKASGGDPEKAQRILQQWMDLDRYIDQFYPDED